MTHKLDSSQTAVVSHENKWIPISQQEPPFGAKCLVIDDTQDLAYVEHINRLQGGLIGFRSRYYPRMKNE